ncbi:ABC transporter permease [Candidatus Nephthysia bennettiae]|uniref:Transport permease protein n=1 Tax=Candidatus Nephthysia bennettiae TaxID=3127016 RepID=A0A934K853_9BACT|nr:ABC transporter permease [Candidatus Dormibacteraeota bacterium]MBJ7610831.1 ABC transporter permease [Candidatus Dormibacteraeota bacterium]
MNRRRVLAITRRILQQFRRDRRTLALLFVTPLVILGLLDFLLRGGGGSPAMGVVNQDGGPLGAAVTRQLEASRDLRASRLDQNTAEARLGDGSLAGYVVLPADFSSRALQERVIAPELHLEGSQPSDSATIAQALNRSLLTAVASLPGAGAAPTVDIRVRYRYGGPSLDTLDYFGGAFIGLVVFLLVFVVTCVSFLRERSQGTLERLMASPLRRAEIVVGYMLGFTVLALVQCAEVLIFSLYVLKVHNSGSVLLIFAVETLLALSAVNLGIFLSMFARTEFQAVQFIPLVLAPQILLGGVIFPVSAEPRWLQAVSSVLPLTYAVDGLRNVMLKGADLTWASLQLDLGVVGGFCLLMMLAAAATLRRRVA